MSRIEKNFVVVVVLLLFFAAAQDRVLYAEGKGAAAVSAWNWLRFVDGSKYDKSWDEASQFFKNAITKEKWRSSLKAVRTPLGEVISRKLVNIKYSTSLPGLPDGEYIIVRYKTSFENKKSALETITIILENDGKWRVAGLY